MLAKIGQNLKGARLARKWTQKDLADRSGISLSMVSAVERGQRNVTIDTLQALAAALGLELQVVMAATFSETSPADVRLIERIRRLLPSLDPALKMTLTLLVDGWEESSRFDGCQEDVKVG